MNPTQLTDQQCLTIWNCCFDSDLREGVPQDHVLANCIRTWLEPGASHSQNIDGLETVALKLWNQDEANLAVQIQDLARERRELN